MAATKTTTRAKRPPKPASSGGPLDRADPPRKAIRKELGKLTGDVKRRAKAPPPPTGRPTHKTPRA